MKKIYPCFLKIMLVGMSSCIAAKAMALACPNPQIDCPSPMGMVICEAYSALDYIHDKKGKLIVAEQNPTFPGGFIMKGDHIWTNGGLQFTWTEGDGAKAVRKNAVIRITLPVTSQDTAPFKIYEGTEDTLAFTEMDSLNNIHTFLRASRNGRTLRQCYVNSIFSTCDVESSFKKFPSVCVVDLFKLAHRIEELKIPVIDETHQ